MSNPSNRIDSNEAAADLWELQRELAAEEAEVAEINAAAYESLVAADAYLAEVEAELRASGEFPYKTCSASAEGLAAVIAETS